MTFRAGSGVRPNPSSLWRWGYIVTSGADPLI